MSESAPYISVIVPIYNEEDSVEILHDEIRKSLDELPLPYEIIFVDDRSSDRTFEQLIAIKSKELDKKGTSATTKIIRFTRNFGQTTAMQAGFDHARGEIIISLDGDLQNDPQDIPELLKKLNQGYDVVCGWRKDRKDKKLTRVLPSKVANWMIRKITGVPIHDNGCSLKAYRTSMIRSIRLYSDMHRFIPAMTTITGARIAEIEVNHRHRRYGRAKYGLSRVWKVLFDIVTIKMLIHFHDRPILWFASFALISCIIGLGLGIVSFILFLQGKGTIVYPASAFLFLFLFGSLISMGLLAEFFLKIENSPQGRRARKR